MRVVRRVLRRLPNLNWISIVFAPVAVIMMEVFWFYPWLVWAGKLDFFTDNYPPLSLGAVILLLGASYIVTRYLLSRDWANSWIRVGILSFGLLLVYATIRSEYHAGFSITDPQWFIHTGKVIISIFTEPHQLIIALPASAYLWWRGINRGRGPLLMSDIYRTFLVGIGSFVLLIIIWQISLGSGSMEDLASTVGPQVAAFFFFALSALALTNLYSIQQRMSPEESIRSFNRRWLPTLFGVVGGIVIIGIAIAGIFSPEFMAFLGRLVNSIFDIARQILYYILIPFGYIAAALVYVFQWLISLIRSQDPPEFEIPEFGAGENQTEIPTGEPISDVVGLILKWVLFAVVAIAVTYFLARAISRFRKSRSGEGVEEINESLWSWEGFKSDLLLFFNTLWQRLRLRRKTAAESAALPYWYGKEDDSPDSKLSIREIYRRLLWQGNRFGVAHRDWETPNEYDRRLGHIMSDGSEQLTELT
ncbi:MAG TPA: DUF4129 domain-containing protein, partial [Dehalococcoidia bacterium]|nr:DUF4129 domain-containing protein [Dehalococcoidia bacterium]